MAIPGAGGGLGHLAVQYAIAHGQRVLGIDTGEDKRKLVEGYGGTFLDFKESKVNGVLCRMCARYELTQRR